MQHFLVHVLISALVFYWGWRAGRRELDRQLYPFNFTCEEPDCHFVIKSSIESVVESERVRHINDKHEPYYREF